MLARNPAFLIALGASLLGICALGLAAFMLTLGLARCLLLRPATARCLTGWKAADSVVEIWGSRTT